LCGNYRILSEKETFRIRRKPIHATIPFRDQNVNRTRPAGRKTSSVTTRSKLAAALNVNIGDLVLPSIHKGVSGAASRGYDATPGLGIN
jgi:hypothetical protein